MLPNLTPEHYQHFINDDWKPEEIVLAVNEYGLRSVAIDEAKQLLGHVPPSGGIWFPFSESWGQLRPDSEKYPDGRKAPKYCSPRGEIGPQALWVPKNYSASSLAGVTEGWKDAFIATIRGGQPIGAIAGVSHVLKALPEGLGITLIFDSDGWQNASVMQSLINGGLHLNGKIVLIPEASGKKAGFTEFFNSGASESDFNDLLIEAQTPRSLFIEWLDYLLRSSLPKHEETLPKLYRKLWKIAYAIEAECPELTSRLEEFCKVHSKVHGATLSKPEIRRIRCQALKPLLDKEQQERRQKQQAIAKQNRRGSWQIRNAFMEAIEFNRKGVKVPPAGKLAALLENTWGLFLKYRRDVNGFYVYGHKTPGQWERVSDLEIGELVQRELDMAGADGQYSQGLIDSTVNLLRQRLSVNNWPKALGFVPFKNGVLRLSDLTSLSHNPHYGFTWQLPYDYVPQVTCEPIIRWLRWVSGDDDSVVQLLRAVLKAAIIGRTFQKYLELIGDGRNGKGTFIRLMQALLGLKNSVSTSFDRMATNRFEMTRFFEKLLVFIPDADYNPAAVDKLKQMTGDDYLIFERKNENSDDIDGFTLNGWVVIATNHEVVPDRSSAIWGRRIPIYFRNKVPEGSARNLLSFDADKRPTGEFAALLPGFFNWVLAMPDERMEAYISKPRDYVRSMGKFQADSLLQTNPLAAWVNENVVYEPGTWTQIGTKGCSVKERLYPNYVHYCESVGLRHLAQNKFSGSLESLLKNQLGYDVERKREPGGGGMGFSNIRLRKTETQYESNSDCNSASQEVPVEDCPLTVETALRGKGDRPLADCDLMRLLNLYHDDRSTYETEFRRLRPDESAYLLDRLPELQNELAEGNGHVV